MKSYYWSMCGLSLDIVGAFFLSVEAIKIDNIRLLRDRYLRPVSEKLVGPIMIPGEEGSDIAFTIKARAAYVYFFDLLHVLAGVLVVGGASYPFWPSIADFLSGVPLPLLIVGAIILVIPLIILLWGLGELVHQSLRGLIWSAIALCDQIDRKTPNGTIGILGFVLVFIGFVGQMLGTWFGAYGH